MTIVLRTLPAVLCACLLTTACTKKDNSDTVQVQNYTQPPCIIPIEDEVVADAETGLSGTRAYKVKITEERTVDGHTAVQEKHIEQVNISFNKADVDNGLYVTTDNPEIKLMTLIARVNTYIEHGNTNVLAVIGKDIEGTFNQGNYKSSKLNLHFNRIWIERYPTLLSHILSIILTMS